MGRLSKKINRVFEVFEKIGDWAGTISATVLFLAVLMILYAVILRRFFGQAPAWSVELGGYMLVLITYVTAAHAVAKGEIPRMLLVYRHFGSKTQAILDIITLMLTLFVLILLLWKGIVLTVSTYRAGYASLVMEVPRWWLLTCIYFGITMLSIQVIIEICRRFQSLLSSSRE